ncbi:MAG: type II toxin-antitoxin system VapC family toxin [Deltaproteobacteria bacterium]|nr:type II toxin-antitoxin system VapC family toxin [Deltaproteobacteria bacterium]
MMLVLDASAAVRVVTGHDADGLLAAALGQANEVVVPDLFAPEVSSALWKWARYGGVDTETALASLRVALALPDRWLPCAELAPEVFELAARLGRPVYDLYYLVAARRLAAVLMTRDNGLIRLAGELGVRVG